jgi:hypothetical protein
MKGGKVEPIAIIKAGKTTMVAATTAGSAPPAQAPAAAPAATPAPAPAAAPAGSMAPAAKAGEAPKK